MKIPLDWIREYTSFPVSPEDYAERMTMTGTAVEGIEYPGKDLEGVVIGRVLSLWPHERSSHLKVCSVDIGSGAPIQVVCGAGNVREGILAPVALEGAVLPGGRRISKGSIRGVESQGMLCSAEELLIPQELYPSCGADGLLILHEEVPVGLDIRSFFGLDGAVANFEILADRPDCLSVWGLARETAAAFQTGFSMPDTRFDEAAEQISEVAGVTVEEPTLCPRYCARVVTRVRTGPSPLWLRKRLFLSGIRPINNIVDITNYVMLETGHPMHAFDLARVAGRRIIVRKAAPGEQLTTLDGKLRDLSGGELLICDGSGPTGLAGIMGGLDSEITDDTREVLFECAAFDRTVTRITARSLGIRSESSARFERGVTAATAMVALERACHLVRLLDAGDIVSGAIDVYPAPIPRSVVTGSVSRIASRISLDLDGDEMVSILRSLSFDAEAEGDRLTAVAPTFRQDIWQEADLGEEILRLAGYERIPSTRLRGETSPGGDSARRRQQKRLAAILHGLGYFETMAFSFMSQGQLDSLRLSEGDGRLDPVRIRNPLGEDTAFLRSSMVPGMLRALYTNKSRGAREARLYEFGTVFDASVRTEEGLVGEEPWLCLGRFGEDGGFYSLRDAILALCAREGVACTLVPGGENYHHPGRCALLSSAHERIAVVGEVHPEIAEAFGLSGRIHIAEINLESLRRHSSPMGTVRSLPRTPAVSRDLALVLPEDQHLLPVMEAIREAAGPLLEDLSLFDVYRGAQIDKNRKSAAFSLVFRAADHTLEEGEVKEILDGILQALHSRFGAALRA